MGSRHRDVVIIGGGHNGLVAAQALARAGLEVLVAEADARPGGCASTEEHLLAGFRHSAHANCLMFSELMPDLISPIALGLTLHQPDAQFGLPFPDGSPPVVLHRPGLLKRTHASLRRYSAADAETYCDLKSRSAALGRVMKQSLYQPPDQQQLRNQVAAVRRAYGDVCKSHPLGSGTARALIDALFRTPQVRTLLYGLALDTGTPLDEAGGDVGFLGYSLWIAGRWRTVSGGMQSYADALAGAARAAGAEIVTDTRISRIVLESGRATGVDAGVHGILAASTAVLAATNVLHLFDDLLEAGSIGRRETRELQAFRSVAAPTIGVSTFPLPTRPRYLSARHDPDIDVCLKTLMGFDQPSDVIAHETDIRRGLLPQPAGVIRVHTNWDPQLAPPGRHFAAVDSSFPAVSSLAPETWRLVGEGFPHAVHERWQSYLTGQGVTPYASSFDYGPQFERRMLLRTGRDQYRTSVSNLYLGGPGTYPGGGIHGACGWNAAQTILHDSGAGT